MFKNIKWNSNKILSISAMSISFLTLIIFIYQTNLMSKQNHLSILPYLAISTSDNAGANTYSISLENHGVGPAIIEDVTLVHMGKKHPITDYNNEFFTFMTSKVPALDSISNISFSTLDIGMAIPINESYNVVKVTGSQEEYELFTTSLKKLISEGLRFEIIYQSIQNERWVISNETQGPEKLD